MGVVAGIAKAFAGSATAIGGAVRAVRGVVGGLFGGGGQQDAVRYEVAPPDPVTLQLLQQMRETNTECRRRMDEALAALEHGRTASAQAAEAAEMEYIRKLKEIRANPDPRRIIEDEKELLETFLAHLRRTFGPGTGPDAAASIAATNQVNVAVIGRVSCGKSTLINALLGRNVLPTGIGRTTSAVQLVARVDLDTDTVAEVRAADVGAAPYRPPRPCINVYDVPGDDERFSYLDMSGAISFLATMHVVVVLFTGCISDVARYIRIAKAMGKTVIVVRTQVDIAATGEAPIGNVLGEDMRDLQAMPDAVTLADAERRILGVSARNVLHGKEPVYEWRGFRERLLAVGRTMHARYGVSPPS